MPRVYALPLLETAPAARQACVADARLVLGPLGVLALARAAREFSVFLPRELREVLREPRAHLDDPAGLLPDVYCGALRALDVDQQKDELRQELAQWERLPDDDELSALPLYWVGERADESRLPGGGERGLRERFEQLQRGLDLALHASGRRSPPLAAACARDAAALCAALEPQSAFVLTRLESDGEAGPALCDYLDAWGVPVCEAPVGRGRTARVLGDALARAGLGPLQWAGVELCAVHVVLPGFPVMGGADKGLDDDAVARLWCQAGVFWHRV